MARPHERRRARHVVILCGGRGTRLQERTQSIPKPLVEIGGRPIVGHVIQLYLAPGLPPLRALHRLHGRAGSSAFVAGEPWPRGVVRGVPRHRARHADRRARARRRATASATGPFCAHLRGRRRRHRPRARCWPPTARTAAWRRSPSCGPSCSSASPSSTADDRVRGLPREAARASTGSTAASSCFEPGVSTTWPRTACWSASRSSGSPPTGSCTRSATTGFWDCMDTYKDAVAAERPVGARARPRGW